MGKGQRHSKNAGVMGSEALTYHEKKSLGYGTVRERLGKDSLGNYFDCCLTLQPATDPVVTPGGYLFSREAILSNLLAQKKAIKRKLAEWADFVAQEEHKAAERAALEAEAHLVAFDRQNHSGVSERTAKNIQSAIQAEVLASEEVRGARSVVAIKEQEERMREMKAFWVPGRGTSAREVVEKPDTHTYCPASGHKLCAKDLVAVRFTHAPDGDAAPHLDPLTREPLRGSSRLVVLAPTGDVMHLDTYEKCVKPEGNFNGKHIRKKDVIHLKTGGTGFAAHDGGKVQAKKSFVLGPGSGLADLRGQHQGPRSLGGLAFMN